MSEALLYACAPAQMAFRKASFHMFFTLFAPAQKEVEGGWGG